MPGPDLLNRADVSGLAITYPPVEVGVGNADGSVESDCQAILARTPRFDWKAPFEADADQRAEHPTSTREPCASRAGCGTRTPSSDRLPRSLGKLCAGCLGRYVRVITLQSRSRVPPHREGVWHRRPATLAVRRWLARRLRCTREASAWLPLGPPHRGR